MEKYGFVYIWRDIKHKRFYIGCHWGHVDDNYICSSTWMRNSYRNRPTDFSRRILERVYTSKKDTFLAEGRWLAMIKSEELGTKYYNQTNRVINHWILNEDQYREVLYKIGSARRGKGPTSTSFKKGHVATKSAFKKGNIPHSKGKTFEEMYGDVVAAELKSKFRNTKPNKTTWVAGQVPWNKGMLSMWITNGDVDKKLYGITEVPQGWRRGRSCYKRVEVY